MYLMLSYEDAAALVDSLGLTEKGYFGRRVYLTKEHSIVTNEDSARFFYNENPYGLLGEVSTTITPALLASADLVTDYTTYQTKNYTIDLFTAPMRIGRVEINECFSSNLKICDLNLYDYFKRRISVSGGPSSGKTTIAQRISLDLNIKYGANSTHVIEYATSFIQKTGRIPTLEDQIWLYVKQKEREEQAGKTSDTVISDSPLWLQYIYALRCMRDRRATPVTEHTLSSFASRAVEALGLYDFNVVLDPIEYKENNVRYHNLEASQEVSNSCKMLLREHGHPFKVYTYKDFDAIMVDILQLNDIDVVKHFLASY